MDKIFIRGFNEYTNVTVGDKFTNEISYIIGYWEAGDILVDKAITLNHALRARLFFPICYNYRQFIELCLKQLILDADKIYNDCKFINMQKKNCKQVFSEQINRTHNIETLLHWLITILNCITDEKMDKNIIKSILEYHKIDKTGQRFRYPVSTKNISHFEFREDFDLKSIKDGITVVGNYLMGVDAYLYEFGNFVKVHIAEIEDIYRGY
jgi:hypothetical protein